MLPKPIFSIKCLYADFPRGAVFWDRKVSANIDNIHAHYIPFSSRAQSILKRHH